MPGISGATYHHQFLEDFLEFLTLQQSDDLAKIIHLFSPRRLGRIFRDFEAPLNIR